MYYMYVKYILVYGRVNVCTVAPSICGASVLNLFHVTLVASTNLKLLLNFWKRCSHSLKLPRILYRTKIIVIIIIIRKLL
jgi:hypothetical protein